MHILHAGGLVRSAHIVRLEVEPVGRWLVAEDEVVASAVVENHVHYHLHALGLSLFHQLAELFVATVATVHLEIVGDGIAVVRSARHVVFLNRVQPDGRYAQVFQIVQMVFNPLEVTSMTTELLVAVHLVFLHTRYDVVGRIAVGKAVGHDEVEHIAGIEALHFRGVWTALLELVRHDGFFPALLQDDVEGLRSCFRQVDIQQQVVRVFLLDYIA